MSGKSILVGWSSRDVTPDKPVNLRGQFHMRIASTVKDPVTVTALALSKDGGMIPWKKVPCWAYICIIISCIHTVVGIFFLRETAELVSQR